MLGRWQPYALLPVGVLGLLLARSSFQAGSPALALPVVDTLEPVGSVLVGAAVLHERPAPSAAFLAVQGLGAAPAVAGIAVLDRPPLVRGGAQPGAAQQSSTATT
ncbi:hypothetical protein LO771_27480 [Streptacidiphilus sp. ASG 303]|uniref:hypothetical protein n=1 Tax=Streptacidiphilus sp. ASG 303 TaxID=2896847 RepID=UPI001E44C103|nr:hypothetical protein [Streptacidiphilus sp. ASG 303]MCD0486026.1 hypothetical protein [Streptacidiphilus sp. ASG 303]